MVRIHNIHKLSDRRKELRKNPTKEEDTLWMSLKNKTLGRKFRRQHSVGGYILDFYCSEKKLIIEIDGGIHNTREAIEYDAVRDKFFVELGYNVLRFTNEEVNKNLNKVLLSIKSFL